MNEKVSFFIANDFPEGTAKNSRIKAYAVGLNQLGFKCSIFVGFSSSFNNSNINTEVSGQWNQIPFEFLSGDVLSPKHFFKKIAIWYKANIACIRQLRKNRNVLSVFYMPSIKGLGLAYFIGSLFHNRRIAIQTEQFSMVHSGIYKLISLLDERLISILSNKILVISKNLEEYYSNLNSNTSVELITPIVVDYNRFNLKNPESKNFTLGYLGTFNPKDGVDTIIQSFSMLYKESPEATLHLIGNSEKFDQTRAPGVIYSGKFRHDELPQLLYQCDVLIVNRLDDEYSRTGFPIKLGEYLATKRPVLLCDFAEYHEYLSKEEVIYFKPNDARDLLEKLNWVKDNRLKANEIGERGHNKGKILFGQQTAALQLKHIFAELIKKAKN